MSNWKFGVVDRIEENNVGNIHTVMCVISKDPQNLEDDTKNIVEMTIFKSLDNDLIDLSSGFLSVKMANFKLGEIIVMKGEYERDHRGDRKPSKWDVGIRLFDDINDAVEYAQKVLSNV